MRDTSFYMALFQRKPQDTSNPPLFSLGLNKTILVVGLGNPGKEYENTRHNVGFACIDYFVDNQSFDPWIAKKDLKCLLTTKQIGSARVIAIKPTTFMNLSGEAVQAVAHFYKVPHTQIIVLHDELDIPFGQIRTRTGGGSAGHNGVKSLTQHIGEAYDRIRVGIQSDSPEAKHMDSADFVLAKFSIEESKNLDALKKETTAILTESIYSGELHAETRSFIF